MTPERRWVLTCLRSVLRSSPPSAPDILLDWGRVVAIAEAEGVAPALGFALEAGTPAGVPGAIQSRLRRGLAQGRARHLILARHLRRLLRGFAREGVPVIPLKGPALAEALYPDPAMRPASDLDLLIPPDAVLAVDRLLQALGYHRRADAHSWSFDLAYDRATLYEGPTGVQVDLHWSLQSDPRYRWSETESLGVWDRAVKTHVAGETVRGLCPEDLLLYLALHLAAHHGLGGLLWYWDLALILDRRSGGLDWPTMLERAARWRVRRALYFALRGCETLFGVSPSARVLAALRPRGPRAIVLGRLVRHPQADRLARIEHLIALLVVDRGRDLAAPLAHAVCPSPAWVRARYHGAGPSLLGGYLAHYRRLAGIARRLETGLVLGAADRGA
jgi:hypothetical protein